MQHRYIIFILILLAPGCSTLRQGTPEASSSSSFSYLDTQERQELRLDEFLKGRSQCSEQEKILYLLEIIQDSDIQFIRNGRSYDGDKAARWLKWKMHHKQYDADPIDTAQEFVTRVSNRSSHTGQPYEARLPDGSYEKVSVVLAHELAALERALSQRLLKQPPLEEGQKGRKVPGSPTATSLFLPAAALSAKQ